MGWQLAGCAVGAGVIRMHRRRLGRAFGGQALLPQCTQRQRRISVGAGLAREGARKHTEESKP